MRRPNITRPRKIHLSLPEDVWARIDIHLFSTLEGRVPVGAYQRFFLERINEYFNARQTDVHP